MNSNIYNDSNSIGKSDTNKYISTAQGESKISITKNNNIPLTMNGINFSLFSNNIDNNKISKSTDKVMRKIDVDQTFISWPYQIVEINSKINHLLKVSKYAGKGRNMNQKKVQNYNTNNNQKIVNRNYNIKSVEIDLGNNYSLTNSNNNMMTDDLDNNAIYEDKDNLKNKQKNVNKLNEINLIKERWIAKNRIEDEIRISVLGEIKKKNSIGTYINSYLNNTLIKYEENSNYYLLTQKNNNLIKESFQLHSNTDFKNEINKFINKNKEFDYIPPVLILDCDQIKNLYDETVNINKNSSLIQEKQFINSFEIIGDKKQKNIIFEQELLNEENQIKNGGVFELIETKNEKKSEKENEDIIFKNKINNSFNGLHNYLIIKKEIELKIKGQLFNQKYYINNKIEIKKKDYADFGQYTPASLLIDKFLIFAVSKNAKYSCPVVENDFSIFNNKFNTKKKFFDSNLMKPTGFYLCIERTIKYENDRINNSSRLRNNNENKEFGYNNVIDCSYNIK